MTPTEAAESLRPTLREHRVRIEAERRVPAALAGDIAKQGLFRMLVPKSLGGLEVHPRVFVDVLAAIGRGDGATGWCVMTGSTTSLIGAYLDPEVAGAMWRDDPEAIMAGVFAPMGRAERTPEGYRLSGRWPFFSGCDNATWCAGGGLVMEGGAPRKLHDGKPEIRSFFFRRDAATRHDTWDTAGLRGTGSHDLEVTDLLVPEAQSCCVLADAPRHDGPLFRFPIFGLLAAGVAAVGLGIARASIDDFRELAASKKRLAAREQVQIEVAQAEGELRAGEALLRSTCDEVWEQAEHGELALEHRARLRLAATQSTRAAVRVVDAMYLAGGGAALYASCPLQRHLRDIHTVTQHIMVAPPTMKLVGRVMLGIETDVSQL